MRVPPGLKGPFYECSMFTKEVVDWRGESTREKPAANFGSSGDTVWGRTDRVFKAGAVVEFG